MGVYTKFVPFKHFFSKVLPNPQPMKTKLFTLLFTCVAMLSIPLMAQQIELQAGGRNTFEYTASDYQNLRISATLNQLNYITVNTLKGEFAEIAVPGYGFSNTPGYPKVPVMKKLIEIPLGASFEVKVKTVSYKDFPLSQFGITQPLIPAQPPLSKQEDPASAPFEYDQDVYARDQFIYTHLVTIEKAGILRGLNLANLEFYPVQYNPSLNTIRVVESVDIQIIYKNAQVDQTISLKERTNCPFFAGTYGMVSNYQPPVTDELITASPVTYVIVSDPMFQQALQPFIQWKTKKGFKVIEAYTNNPSVGTTAASIKSYLAGIYNNPPAGYNPTSFVLLVGDVAQIPAFNGTAGSHVTDNPFVEYTGDNLPEAYIGRFSANNLAQLQPQIDKTLEYEQYLFPNASFLGEAVMVAGQDNSYMNWSNGQINYGTTYYFNAQHGILSHTYLQPEPAGGNYSQNIIQNVSNGVGYANYTAHCSPSGWSNPSFTISNIPSLQNQSKYPLMVGNCCQSSQFNTTCFAEEVLRAENKGAVGYIGGTNNTYWDEDYWWGVGFKTVSVNPVYDATKLGAYDVTFHDHGEPSSSWYVTQGQMFVGGNMAVQQSNTSRKTYYWEIYCLMGDPSLMVYFGVPQPVAASYDNTLLIGMNQLTVNTEEHAYVALSFEGNLLATAMAGPTGVVNLSFAPFTNVGTAQLVITKQNRKPHLGSIGVIPATGPYLVVQTITVNDSLGNNNWRADYHEDIFLNVTFKNVGVQPAANVEVLLQTTDPNVVPTDTVRMVQNIGANATFLVRNAFRMNINPNVPDQHNVPLTFVMGDGTNNWTSDKSLKLYAPVLQIGDMAIDDAITGNGNGILDPGETATVIISTKNAGSSPAVNSIGHLGIAGGSSPYLMVLNNTSSLGTITPGATQQAVFSVISNIITPSNTPVMLEYTATAGLINQFAVTEEKQVTIGATPVILMANGNTTTCNARFYDSGGPANDYDINENFVMTFYPGIPGAKARISFNSFNVEQSTTCNWDYLQVYNGTLAIAPNLIGTYCGTSLPPAFTANNNDGAITIKFKSDGVVTKPGWDANITCVGGNLTAIAAAFPPEICAGGSTQLGTLTQGGTGNYSYVWHPGKYLNDSTSPTPIATPGVTTEFTVEVNDGANTIMATTTVVVHPIPQTPVVTLQGSTLVSNFADGNQWCDANGPIAGATGQTYTPEESGAYHTIVTSQFGCTSAASNSVYVQITGIENIAARAYFVVFPNPFSQELNIRYTVETETSVKVQLINSIGQEMKVPVNLTRQLPGKYEIRMGTEMLQPGVYYIRFTTDNTSVIQKAVLSR